MDQMKLVGHHHLSKLFHNKFIVVLGSSIQRSVYKDIVLLLQQEKYLNNSQLKKKGEMSFEQDCLVEGGCLSKLHNGTSYREVRQYQSTHHLVRFYFVTRIFSDYMKSILRDFRHGLKPDLVVVNSCVWDISRHCLKWNENYKENLNQFFEELNEILPKESLVIWNLTMPLAETIKGGFLVPEISNKASHLRHDVVEANFYSKTLANAYKLDVLDLHFHFRFSLHHRTRDGIHWNALAHRQITTLLTQHVADAWGVELPPLKANIPVANQLPVHHTVPRHEVCPPRNNFHRNPAPFMNSKFNPMPYWYENGPFQQSHFTRHSLPDVCPPRNNFHRNPAPFMNSKFNPMPYWYENGPFQQSHFTRHSLPDALQSFNSPGSPLSYFTLHTAPQIFDGRQVWTAGWPGKYPHSFTTKPRCCNTWLGIVLLK
ncbi:PC-esterase domain-containing protein 1A isoform X3 [Nerophis ophidion]|uniref:PC-esterase domain-containing protein 1A isoform X3 n=1 Tax=Nerophis ophidion TaxID=159077 RepID=UPI002AE09A68|nr:PC-esterase domain-containing protein 1A isoform X3 [Nerophis ophidion]